MQKAMAPLNMLKKTSILLVFFFLCAFSTEAGGMRDSSRKYEYGLIDRFETLLNDVAASKLTAFEAKDEMKQLRERYDQDYNELSGILDALIDAVAEKTMTKSQALAQFASLMENEIQEYNAAKERAAVNGSRSQGTGTGQQGNGQSGSRGGPGSSGNGKH